MTTEFDDLFDTEEIACSKALNEGRAILNQTEEILDHIAGSYRDIPFHGDTVSNTDELRKVFQKSGNQAAARMPTGAVMSLQRSIPTIVWKS
jgi:hypothetical protein